MRFQPGFRSSVSGISLTHIETYQTASGISAQNVPLSSLTPNAMDGDLAICLCNGELGSGNTYYVDLMTNAGFVYLGGEANPLTSKAIFIGHLTSGMRAVTGYYYAVTILRPNDELSGIAGGPVSVSANNSSSSHSVSVLAASALSVPYLVWGIGFNSSSANVTMSPTQDVKVDTSTSDVVIKYLTTPTDVTITKNISGSGNWIYGVPVWWS